VSDQVGTENSIPQGAQFASGSDSTATVMRYLIEAKSLDTNGEIRVTQAGKTLAVIPVDASDENYFGTFSTTVGVPVTAVVTSGDIVVKTIFIYRAGAAS
jgi:hypothetical protein